MPQCLLEETCFNISLTGDQMVLYYGFAHRSVKWWKRGFFHLLDLTLVKSHILYKAATSSKITQLDFRLSVARSLIEGHKRPSRRHHISAPELPLRLTERAFPEPIPSVLPRPFWRSGPIRVPIRTSSGRYAIICS